MSNTKQWFISGPLACAYVYRYEHIEPVIAALCEITGDDNDEYTATEVTEEIHND